MPDTDTLNIITININTTDTQDSDKSDKCNTSTANCQDSRHGQHYTNIMQEANKAKKNAV